MYKALFKTFILLLVLEFQAFGTSSADKLCVRVPREITIDITTDEYRTRRAAFTETLSRSCQKLWFIVSRSPMDWITFDKALKAKFEKCFEDVPKDFEMSLEGLWNGTSTDKQLKAKITDKMLDPGFTSFELLWNSASRSLKDRNFGEKMLQIEREVRNSLSDTGFGKKSGPDEAIGLLSILCAYKAAEFFPSSADLTWVTMVDEPPLSPARSSTTRTTLQADALCQSTPDSSPLSSPTRATIGSDCSPSSPDAAIPRDIAAELFPPSLGAFLTREMILGRVDELLKELGMSIEFLGTGRMKVP